MGKRAEFVIPISFGSTEIFEPGKWGFAKPDAMEMTATCRAACPAGINIPRFLHSLQRGDFTEALAAILVENPLPGVCGRGCYHPCESGCNRARFDESVSVHFLERFTADSATGRPNEIQPLPNENPTRVAVVGAGPAGLSCAYFLSLLGHHVTIFEARKEAGGVMRWGIPEYRLPKKILNRELDRIFSFPMELKTKTRVGKDISFRELNRFDAVFLSPGAGIGVPLSIKGENLKGVLNGGDFLERINAGEAVHLGRETIVIGGGNTAMDVARSALRLGTRVTIAYRRTRNEMPAIPDEIIEAEEEGARFRFLVQPVRIELAGKKLTVTFQRMQLSVADKSNRLKAVPIRGSYVKMETNSLITAAGESVDVTWIPKKLVKNGLIHPGFAPRIFAGGDAIAQPRSIAAAIASGKRGAISIDLFQLGQDDSTVLDKIRLGDGGSISMELYLRWRREGTLPQPSGVLAYEQIKTLFFQKSRRLPIRKRKHDRLKNFLEVNLGYNAKKAMASAARCFACGMCNYCSNCDLFCPEGVISVDPRRQIRIVDLDHCKGCGTCARACPRSVLQMKEPS
jgi:NADPH-dependent glutamate synthase beta subunit-like oxidoreductase